MPLNGIRLITVIIVLMHFNVHAQDKIYSKAGIKVCKIIEVNATTVTYLPLRRSKPVTMYVNNILLLFNEKGLYMVPSKMDFSLQKNQEFIKKFLFDGVANQARDYIYKNDNTFISGDISNEDKNFIYLDKDAAKIDKKSISAIIYKDGHHVIIAPVTKAAEILWAKYVTDVSPNKIAITVAKKDTVLKIINNKKSVLVDKPTTPTSPKNVAVAKAPLVNETKTLAKENGKTKTDTLKKVVNDQPPAQQSSASPYDDLPPLRKKDFEVSAMNKAKQLSDYLQRICDKRINSEEIDKAMNQAVLLFVNENAIVEVSSLKEETKHRKIREYLKHLKLSNYNRIDLKWTKVQYVTEIKKRPDGNYSGTITFEQEFKGYKDGVVVYSDVTVKKALVILKTYEKNVDGKAINLWEVLLGDIGVESTRAL